LETLVQRIRAGETAAERDLVERFSRGIRAILQTVARERAVSEDLHQEALRILLERVRAGGVRDPSQLPAFVASLARNLATRHYQRARRVAGDSTLRLARVEDDRPDPVDQLLRAEQRALVRQIVEELPVERDRELLRRYYLARRARKSSRSTTDSPASSSTGCSTGRESASRSSGRRDNLRARSTFEVGT